MEKERLAAVNLRYFQVTGSSKHQGEERIYLERCWYEGIYFHFRDGKLGWSGRRIDEQRAMGGEYFDDLYRQEQNFMNDVAAGVFSHLLGDEIGAAEMGAMLEMARGRAFFGNTKDAAVRLDAARKKKFLTKG